MKTIKIISTVVTILLIVTGFSFGQQSKVLKGKVINEKLKAIPYADIALYNSSDSTLITGDFCNKDGEFEILLNTRFYRWAA